MKTKSLILAAAVAFAGIGVATAGDCYYGNQRYVPRKSGVTISFGSNQGYRQQYAPRYYAPRVYQQRRVVVQQPTHYRNDRRIVLAVQRELLRQGYYRGRCDGLWGPATQHAVILCQRNYGLPVSGLIDQTLIRHLF